MGGLDPPIHGSKLDRRVKPADGESLVAMFV